MANEPLLIEEGTRRKLAQLMLVANKVRAGAMKGDRRSTKRGTSIEFADYRNYAPGDDLRRQGNDDQLAQQGHRQADLFGAEPPFEQVKDASLQRRHQHDQAQRGHKAQLKAHVPQNQRVNQSQHQGRGEQRIYRESRPP